MDDYESYTPEDLLSSFFNCQVLARMIRAVFFIRAVGLQMRQRDFIAAIILLRPGDDQLRGHLPTDAINFYRWLEEEESTILQEVERRCKGKKVGAALVAAEFGLGEGHRALQRFLGTGKFKAYYPWEMDENDIEGAAFTRLLELYRESSNAAAVNRSVEMLTIIDLSDKERAICRKLAELMGPDQQDLVRRLSPVLAGELEEFPETVRLWLRGVWRKIKHRRALFTGKEEFPSTGVEACIADWDWSEMAATARSHDLAAEVHSAITTPEGYVQRAEEENQNVLLCAQAYKIAEARWGKRASHFLDLLKGGATLTDAAKMAGVSRVTGDKYRKEIARQLAKEEGFTSPKFGAHSLHKGET
jgi:hypothetical protein